MSYINLVYIGFLVMLTGTGLSQGNSESLSDNESDQLQTRVVISSLPSIKIETDENGSTKTKLSAEQASKNLITIIKAGGSYFWATRQYRPLIRNDSGLYTTFVCPKGGGYIKIEKTLDGKFKVMEHVTIGMVTITYFGDCPAYHP